MFNTFREIPVITHKASESEVKRWKQSIAVRNCYEKLNKRVDPKRSETFMKMIINDVFKKKDVATIQIALVMTVCEVLLDSSNNYIHLNEEIIKPRLERNLVSVRNLHNNLIML